MGIIRKVFLKNEKIPLISPLFYWNEYVTDFKKKANFFNSFFAKQCTLISNTIELPLNLHYTTENPLDALNVSNSDVERTKGIIFNKYINSGSFPEMNRKKPMVINRER